MTRKFRIKPVDVEVILWNGKQDRAQEINAWNGNQFWPIKDDRRMLVCNSQHAVHAHVGDYIIKDAKGEFSVCISDKFWDTYEEVIDKTGWSMCKECKELSPSLLGGICSSCFGY